MTDNVTNKGPDSEQDATPEQRAYWRKMEQYERAVGNVLHWQSELDLAKKYLKKWKGTADRLSKDVAAIEDKFNAELEAELEAEEV